MLTETDQQIMDEFADIVEDAESAGVDEFSDPQTGLKHNHGVRKHRIGDVLVRDEHVQELESNPNSHEAVHEAYYRADELGIRESARDQLESLVHNDEAPISPSKEVELRRKYNE